VGGECKVSPILALAAILIETFMLKSIFTVFLCIISTQSYCQKERNFSTYLHTQYNKTIYDRTLGNNPWGIGLGIQAFLINHSKFRPTIELTADNYLEDDKVLRLNQDSTHIDDVGGMINVFAGASYHPSRKIFFSLVMGTSFVGGQTLLGIKPTFGFYFTQSQKWTGKISFINVFNRDEPTKDDFGSISLSIGLKIF
jgi:hypothetical protein